MLKTLFSNLFMASGIIVFALAVLDILLSDLQKKNISNWLVRAWHTLDDVARISFIDRFRKPTFLILYTIANCIVVAAAATLFIVHHPSEHELSLGENLIAGTLWVAMKTIIAGAYVHRCLSWVLKEVSPARVFIRVLLTLLLPVAATITLGLALYFQDSLSMLVNWLGHFAFIISAILALIVLVALYGSVVWVAAVTPLIVLMMLSVAVLVSEFVMRRIAEHSKGPMIAAGLLLSAIGSVLKLVA